MTGKNKGAAGSSCGFMRWGLAIGVLISAIFGFQYWTASPGLHLTQVAAEYDYIIIGGGSAGSLLAGRLSDDAGVTVLLLEAGDEELRQEVSIPLATGEVHKNGSLRDSLTWDYTYEAGIPMMSGRVLGGGSSVNAMFWVRGDAMDYDRWSSEYGCEGWNWESIQPHFLRLENWHGEKNPLRGSSGPIDVTRFETHDTVLTEPSIRAAESLGHKFLNDYNLGKNTGISRVQANIYKGKRVDMASVFLRPYLQSRKDRLHVRTKAHVSRVVFTDKTATAVEWIDLVTKEKRTTRVRREVILSAGALGTPKVLQLSGVGPKELLNKFNIPVVLDAPGVGANFQDHPAILQSFPAVHPELRPPSPNELQSVTHLVNYLLNGVGPLAYCGFDLLMFWRSDVADAVKQKEDTRPDLQAHLGPWNLQAYPQDFCYDRDDLGLGSEETAMNSRGLLFINCLLHPFSRGVVQIRSADPLVAPLIDPKFLSDKRDVDALASIMKESRKLVRSAPLKDLLGAEFTSKSIAAKFDPESDEYLKEFVKKYRRTLYHPVGTARCGRDGDPNAVLHPDLRVRGLRNIRVVDASAIPELPTGNTHAPTLALADRAVELIKSYWAKK